MPLPLNILVTGSGISGLSTAISLQHTSPNHTLTLLKRHACLQALGGPIGLTPNATRILIYYGLKDILAPKASTESQTVNFRTWSTGEALDTMKRDTEGNFGYPYVHPIQSFDVVRN
jgi:salicylate hydroxylase